MEEAQSKLYTLRKRKNKLVRVWRGAKQAVYPQEEKKQTSKGIEEVECKLYTRYRIV